MKRRKKLSRILQTFGAGVFTASLALMAGAHIHAQGQGPTQKQQDGKQKPAGSMAGMNMPGMSEEAAHPDAARAANEDMSHMGMNMNAHMFMTTLRPANTEDEARAEKIVEELRPAIEKYKDYRVALEDGYRIFMPNVPQEHYHFTSWRNAMRAQFTFDPARPTSLLYKKVNGEYVLEGAMYTAPKRFSENQLDKRVPLSVARWHKHVNLCLPAKGTPPSEVNWKEFGQGSIATEEACDVAGDGCRRYSTGWCTCTRSKRIRPRSGRTRRFPK